MPQILDMRGILLANSGSPKRASNYRLGNRPSTAWKLAAGYRAGKKLALRVLYPRPDAETNTYSLHRNASANWQYEVRICIQGGEAPFRWDITAGPAGATIANEMARTTDSATGLTLHSFPADYAILKWPAPTGTGNFTVRVTDQNDDFVDVVWSATVNESHFLVVDATNGNDTTGTGTFAAPLKTLVTGVWKDASADTANAQKSVAFKAGTYAVYQTSANNNVSVSTTSKPRNYFGIARTGVTLDMSQGHMNMNCGDFAFKNLVIDGSRNAGNDRLIQMSNTNSNYHLCNLSFVNNHTDSASTDNPACIFLSQNYPSFHTNVSIVDCTLNSTSTFQLHSLFTVDGILSENNSLIGVNFPASNGNVAISLKDDIRNATVRFCRVTGPSATIVFMNQQQAAGGSVNQECCFNYLETTASSSEAGPIQWNQNSTGFNNPDNTFCYRNTIYSMEYGISAQKWIGGQTTTISANIHTSSSGNIAFSYSSGFTLGTPADVLLAKTKLNISTGVITDSTARIANLGKVGFEIAST